MIVAKRVFGFLSLLAIVVMVLPVQVGAQQKDDEKDDLGMRGKGIIPRIEKLGPEKVIPVPERDMFYFDEAGNKVDLEQDVQFIALRFAKDYVKKEQREDFYKHKVVVAISEIRKEELLERDIHAVRLVPGGTVKRWNVMAEYMKKDVELTGIYRVFSQVQKNGLKQLLVASDRIFIKFKDGISEKEKKAFGADYPVKIVDEGAGRLVATLNDKKPDTINLANAMLKSNILAYAVPELIVVKGTKVTPELKKKLKEQMPTNIKPNPFDQNKESNIEEAIKRMKQQQKKQAPKGR